MRKTAFIASLLSMLCLGAPFARAELVVGNAYSPQSGVIHVFADGAAGNVAPLREIVPGVANAINTASFIEFEPGENVLYVADLNNWRVQKLRLSSDRAKPSAR